MRKFFVRFIKSLDEESLLSFILLMPFIGLYIFFIGGGILFDALLPSSLPYKTTYALGVGFCLGLGVFIGCFPLRERILEIYDSNN